MSTLPQVSQPLLTVRGSRFTMPAFCFTLIAIVITFFWCASNPFFSFSSFIGPFVVPLVGLVRFGTMTRATFFGEYCQVQRTAIGYSNIASVKRGRFTLTVMYRRENDAPGAKLRRAKLPWIEMRTDDQQACLEILRANLPAAAVSGLQE